MKIKRIAVNELFGIFDHDIPLNTDEHITIIHGPNGYGKTILLTLVNALFNSQYYRLRIVPFSELIVCFDDECLLSVKKIYGTYDGDRKKRKNGHKLILRYFKPGDQVKVYEIEPMKHYDSHISLNMISRKIPGLERNGSNDFFYFPTREHLSFEEVLERFGYMLPPSYANMEIKDGPRWLEEIKESTNIRIIESQRLLSASYLRDEEYDLRGPLAMVPAVMNFSEELVGAIQSKLAEYGALSQSLDRTFPNRLIEGKSEKASIEELRTELKDLETKLKDLEEKRSHLYKTGFLDKEEGLDFKRLQRMDESSINVLSLYVKDVRKKLGVFDELYARINLLLQMINSRFLHKELSISKKEGFVFTTRDRKKLSAANLSSGEQHELVLLYEMLFKVNPNSLILIDEPELSLHVAWQQQFLEDLEKVTKLVGFDVLIATHSPQIINDRWDLTVELEGPKQ